MNLMILTNLLNLLLYNFLIMINSVIAKTMGLFFTMSLMKLVFKRGVTVQLILLRVKRYFELIKKSNYLQTTD